MNHDYEGVLGKNTERRSRRNPKMRSAAPGSAAGEDLRREKEVWEARKQATAQKRKELDVMGDATVRPLKQAKPKTKPAAETNGAERARFKPETSTRAERTRSEERQAAARQMAVSGGSAPLGGGKQDWKQTLENRKKRRRRRMITMIAAECVALVFIFGYAYVARKLNLIQKPSDVKLEEVKANNDLNQETVERMKGYWTIAVFGVDARDKTITKGTNADVNIICNINRDTGEIKLVSVFRDTYLNISDKGTYNKFNQAYFLGGPEQAMKSLNKNLDLDITDYMTFNWKAVADAINVLGGVDIELSKAEFYYINSFITETVKSTGVGSHQLTHAGMNHLDGVQAVAYGRLRLMDTDFARTERQRKIIAQAFEKAKKSDFKTLNVLIGTVFPQVSTSIGVDDLVSNAKNISKFHLGETTGFPQARGDVSMGKKGAMVVPQTLESNVVKLHEFLFGDTSYTPSQTVKDISAKIAADTGMYKEGNYIDKVGTGGGVIQPPKATKPAKPAETTEADKESSKESTKESEKETSKGKVETDENGDPIEETTEPETDEDGNPLETTSKGNGLKPTAPETDADGSPLETTRHPRPDETEEGSTSQKPTRPGTAKPGETEESTDSTKPGGSGTNRPGGNTGNGGTSPTPGSSDDETGAARPGTGNTKPGGNTGSGTGTAPGGNTGNGTGTTPGGSTGNGAGTTPGGSNGNGTGTKPGTGTAGAPGSGTSKPGTTPGGGASSTPGGIANHPGGGTGTAPGGGSGTGSVPGGSTGGPGSGTGSIPAPPPAGGEPGGSGNGVVSRPGM